jgi:hypothetical protein
MALNGRMISEEQTKGLGKMWWRPNFEIASRHLPGWTEENQKKKQS